ncbi:UNVERIFIED_CONTAM: hypothetical protein Sangu_1712800 [Sesamum angustifolium]|uniref:Uncharacterized protein n=1 Tax=Sesamum angustifolium TaxID=2727405 RepID=A0AAW2MMG0_9LAMI
MARRWCRSTLRRSTAPLLQEEQTPTAPKEKGISIHYGDATEMDWGKRMGFDIIGTKKLVRDLGLPVEKIDVGKNGCILYWKDNIDLDYCKFCGGARYKPTGERNPNSKKTPYAILRYLPLTPRLQRSYASEATTKQMTWHANY